MAATTADIGYDAVLLVSFGGPEGPDDVMPFLENVTRGRGVPTARLEEVAQHYQRRGGRSPINDHSRALLAALREALVADGLDLPVEWGNRNWRPYLSVTLRALANQGASRVLAIATSAYSSYSSCRQYLDDIERARAEVGPRAPQVDKIRPFFNHPGFVEALVDRVRDALDDLPPEQREQAHLAFTAHSIPVSMAAACDYEEQLRETSRLVVERLERPLPWELVWQSRSGPTQVPWLEPDIGDHLADLAGKGVDTVVIVPVGFVSDHMEVVHDLDTEATARAGELGMQVRRAGTVGTHPRFVAALAELVRERLEGATPVAMGRLPGRPHVCPPDCCPPPRRPGS
jgi:ferrochelatase